MKRNANPPSSQRPEYYYIHLFTTIARELRLPVYGRPGRGRLQPSRTDSERRTMASARWHRFLLPAALAALALPPLAWLSSHRHLPAARRPNVEDGDGWADHALAVVGARSRLKERLARGVLQGGLTLREAAGRLRD